MLTFIYLLNIPNKIQWSYSLKFIHKDNHICMCASCMYVCFYIYIYKTTYVKCKIIDSEDLLLKIKAKTKSSTPLESQLLCTDVKAKRLTGKKE